MDETSQTSQIRIDRLELPCIGPTPHQVNPQQREKASHCSLWLHRITIGDILKANEREKFLGLFFFGIVWKERLSANQAPETRLIRDRAVRPPLHIRFRSSDHPSRRDGVDADVRWPLWELVYIKTAQFLPKLDIHPRAVSQIPT